MKKITLYTVLVLALAVAMAAAQPGPAMGDESAAPIGMGRQMGGGPGFGMGHFVGVGMRGRMGAAMFLQLADKLELTDQQRDQLKKMQEDFQLHQVDGRANLEKAEIKLRSLMSDEKSSEKEVLAGIDEVAALRADLAKARFTHLRQCRSVLTDKQLDTLKQLRRDRMEKWMGGSQKQGDHPGPGAGGHRRSGI